MLELNSSAPDFSLQDQDGALHSLADFKGQWLVIYFYPKDDTPGCTIEACTFRDDSAELTAHNIHIVGISKDTVKSHKKFAEKFHLNFPLLSDTATTTIQAYGAWAKKKFMGKEYMGINRNTYIVDPTGKIRKIYENVTPLGHSGEILLDVQSFA